MSMSTNTGGLRQNLPSTFQDNAPNGGRPQTAQSLANIGQQGMSMPSPSNLPGEIDTGELKQIDPGFNVNPLLPGITAGGKGGMFGPAIQPGSPGGKGMFPSINQPGGPTPGKIDKILFGEQPAQPTLPPQMQQPLPGPGYVGGIRTAPSNYRPPNQGGGILRSRRTGMPINR